jgi:hypothetical protein
MGIAEHCVFGNHVGMADETLWMPVSGMEPEKTNGYLSTMLIRKSAVAERRAVGTL